ncbi:NAD(P)H-binding protein [Kribbella sp. NBC_01505]|uniref:NAD(P)-dependent oxidoreductase n=1 Tax=Kribbella sp. NBC_01505 TaxID=2903580 RepID=UPI00386F0D54
MKIAVYGASGMVGSRIVAEAVGRGHEVTGVTRSGGDFPAGVQAVQASANDVASVKEIVGDADVVAVALGPSRTGGDPQDYVDAVDNLLAAARGTETRLLFVGGTGGLTIGGQRVVDGPDFPAEYKPEALVVANVLDTLRATDETVDWTMLHPAYVIQPGERTGTFRLGQDEPVGSEISAEDYAVALIDEVEKPANRRQRFTVGY